MYQKNLKEKFKCEGMINFMSMKKRILLAIGIIICIATICIVAFNIIGLNNNDIIETGFLKGEKIITFKSAKNYDYMDIDIKAPRIENNTMHYEVISPKKVVIHRGHLNRNRIKTNVLQSQGAKGIWKIKLICKNKDINLEYEYHIKTGNYKKQRKFIGRDQKTLPFVVQIKFFIFIL